MNKRHFLALLLCLASPLSLARHHHASDAGAQPGQFDYYLLSLSWSPAYCLTHQEDRAQCGGKGLGLVLHGLWPQYDSGGYPEYCGGAPLSGQEAALGLSLYPSPKLMQHEWQSHGTCSGLDAAQYFRTADRALAALQVPAMLEAPQRNQSLSGEQITAAFRAANPALSGNGLAVVCSHAQLSEVRVCLTRELALRACGRGVRSNCPDFPVLIPSSR
jgi:ribonuclease T2